MSIKSWGLNKVARVARSKAILIGLVACGPTLMSAAPTVLIDEVPSGGTFLGLSPIKLPFKDAETADRQKIEEGLNGAISRIVETADQKGVNFVCLLSPPGENPIHIYILSALADLKLSRTDTAVTVLLYHGGHEPLKPPHYSLGSPTPGKPKVSMTAKKTDAPAAVTTSGWMYYNLSIMQEEAEKQGSPEIFLASGGTGRSVPLVIPGLKDPVMAFDDNASFDATWYLDPKSEAAHRAAAAAAPSGSAP